MADHPHRTQILHEISLAISPAETLESTAETALQAYLQKLNCTVGGVFSRREDGGYDRVIARPAAAVDDPVYLAARDRLIERAAGDTKDDESDTDSEADTNAESFPIVGEVGEGGHYYLFELCEFGVLLLGTRGSGLPAAVIDALGPLNDKLATACAATAAEATLRNERRRFEALFTTIQEPMVTVSLTDGRATITRRNEAFETTFGDATSTTEGSRLEPTIPATDSEETATGDETETADIDAQLTDGQPVTAEVSRQTTAGSGDFLLRAVPVTTATGREFFLLYVDITDEKRRRRTLASLYAESQAVLTSEDRQTACERTIDTAMAVIDASVAEVQLYDRATDALTPAATTADEPVFAAVATRLEAELALDSTRETDADAQTESETAETDVESAGSEPTRVEPEDKSHDIDPTPVISRVTEEPQDGAPSDDDEADDSVSGVGGEAGPGATDSASDADGTEPSTAATAGEEPAVGSNDAGPAVDAPADQSPDDTAGEQSTVETSAADPASDTPDDGLAADTPDVGTAAESAGEAVADETVTDTDEATTDTDEATTYIDEAEPAFDSATADPSDESTGAETPPGESAVDARGAGRPVDASAGTADSSTDEAATGTADEGTVEESTTPDSSPDASSDDAPDGEATPGPAGGESPADPDDGARIDDTPGDGEEPGADVSDGSPGPAVPEADTGASAAAGTEPSLDAAAVATPDGSEDGPSADGESTADSTGRPWEPGTVRADHADTAVEFAAFWGEHDLDFSPASLSRLDDLVDAEWDDDRFAETAFGSDASFDDRAFTSVVRELGGYFGEVLVRELGGEWTDETDHEAAVVVGGPSGQFAVPVFEVAITSLRKQAVFGRSYDALLEDLGRDGPTR